jgi:hypothetical protein
MKRVAISTIQVFSFMELFLCDIKFVFGFTTLNSELRIN